MATENPSKTAFETDFDYTPRTSTLFGLFTSVAVFGWIVSTFLTGIHFFLIPQIPEGAEIPARLLVVTSEYSDVFGVPLATLGAFYYLTTTILAGLWWETRHPLVVKILTPVTTTGVLASALFVYLMLGPIGAICSFCMMSAAASTTLFVLELIILRTNDLPPTSELFDGFDGFRDRMTVTWPVLAAAVSLLAIAAFYAATIPPVPGA